MRRHPSPTDLMAYAEGLVDRCASFSIEIAAHVSACARCRAEVEAMGGSLRFAAEAAPLTPSDESAARILLAAQQTRRALPQVLPWARVWRPVRRVAALAAVMALVVTFGFRSVPRQGNPVAASMSQESEPASLPAFSDRIREGAEEVQALAAAAAFPANRSQSDWERAQWRTVQELDLDIAEGLAALEHNPGCTRAGRVVSANLERQADTLRTLYIHREL